MNSRASSRATVSDWVEPLVMSATPAELDRWAEDIFEAPTLEGLLGRTS